jgi:hypothetical protein
MFEWLLNRKINKLAQKGRRHCVFRNLDGLQSFLILFEASEYEDVLPIMASLEKIGKQVSAYGYVSKDDNTGYPPGPCRMLFPKADYNRFGYPSGGLIEEIKNASHDIVLDLTLKKNRLLRYLLISSSAPFRAGMHKSDARLHDLSISANTGLPEGQSLSVKYLGEQIIHYLQTIRMKSCFSPDVPKT